MNAIPATREWLEAYSKRGPASASFARYMEMKEIRDELRTRGLYEANCGQFVTIPVE